MNNIRKESTREVLIFSLSWALYIVQSKRAFSAGAQIVSFQVQVGLAALGFLSLFMLPRVIVDIRKLFRDEPKAFWQLFIGNGLHFGLGGTLYAIGVSQTAAINAGFLVKGSMVSTTLLAWILLKEKMSWKKALNLLLILTGIYLLTTRGVRLLPKIGDLYILGACLVWSTGNILLRIGLKNSNASPNLASYLKPLAGLPVFFIFLSLLPDKSPLAQAAFSLAHLDYALFAGILLAMTWIFLNRSLKITTASYVTMISSATPIFVSILAMLLLHERLAPIQALGGAMIVIAGVFVYFSDMSYR